MSIHYPTCVLADPEQFSARVCACGVVHLAFGPVIINATPEVVIAITETMMAVAGELVRGKTEAERPVVGPPPPDLPRNVVRGYFPVRPSR